MGSPGKWHRVLRGGSWNNNPDNLRAANRNRNNADNRNNNVGFRVVCRPHRLRSRRRRMRRGERHLWARATFRHCPPFTDGGPRRAS
ncbi:MAG: SUMF1/EgtB/PvdO family nonheme iron enzyme [Parahaliea sp.]